MTFAIRGNREMSGCRRCVSVGEGECPESSPWKPQTKGSVDEVDQFNRTAVGLLYLFKRQSDSTPPPVGSQSKQEMSEVWNMCHDSEPESTTSRVSRNGTLTRRERDFRLNLCPSWRTSSYNPCPRRSWSRRTPLISHGGTLLFQ